MPTDLFSYRKRMLEHAACRQQHRLEELEPRTLLSTTPVISEFMASNDNTQDGNVELSEVTCLHR